MFLIPLSFQSAAVVHVHYTHHNTRFDVGRMSQPQQNREGLRVEVEIVLARALGDIRNVWLLLENIRRSVGENHKRAYRSNKTDGV